MRKSLPVAATFVFCWVLLTATMQAQFITTAQADLDNELLIIIGSGFGPTSQVFMGEPNGTLDQLAVINSGPNFAVATLLTTDPGNYLVLLTPSLAAANVFVGPQGFTDARHNTAFGGSALSNNTNGRDNTAVGRNSLGFNTDGQYNTAMGKNALYRNTRGLRNTAIGNAALGFNTTGDENIAVGNLVLYGTTTGAVNTATGSFALQFNTTGGANTAIGHSALQSNTTGRENTAI